MLRHKIPTLIPHRHRKNMVKVDEISLCFACVCLEPSLSEPALKLQFVSDSGVFLGQALATLEGLQVIRERPLPFHVAMAFFEHAASHFNDADAQFELAKHTLSGDGVEAQVPFALNWLAKLSKRGHAGAQAFLANLYWDGRYTVHDPVRALALITVAVENANDEDLFWIEDAHQNIFCEAGRDTRRSVHRVVGDWRHRFGRMQSASAGGQTEPPLGRGNQRTCANGDVVGDLEGPVRKQGAQSVSGDPLGNSEASVRMSRVKPDKSGKAALNGFALREAGATGPKDGVMATPTVETARTRSIPADNRSLNGFMLQGSSDFGFSAAPGRR